MNEAEKQAKTLSDLLFENILEWDEWLRLGVTEKKQVELAPKYQEKWIPLEFHVSEKKKQDDKIAELKEQLAEIREISDNLIDFLVSLHFGEFNPEIAGVIEKLERLRGLAPDIQGGVSETKEVKEKSCNNYTCPQIDPLCKNCSEVKREQEKRGNSRKNEESY